MTEPESNGFYAPQMRKVPTGDLVKPSRKTNGAGVQAEDTRICVVMVGLPARGKSLIAQKGKDTSAVVSITLADMTSL
jgi:6-phosphofructo-2-kinase/fructose-2,6-biphosphatase 2